MKLAHRRSTEFNAAKAAEIGPQPASIDIWDKKYRLKSKDGQVIDEDIDQTYLRIARALSEVELTPEKREHWCEKFLVALRRGRHSGGEDRLERRRPGPQARHVHDQLHGVPPRFAIPWTTFFRRSMRRV